MKQAPAPGTQMEINLYSFFNHLSTSFVAFPTQTINKPVAIGSRVPAWPTCRLEFPTPNQKKKKKRSRKEDHESLHGEVNLDINVLQKVTFFTLTTRRSLPQTVNEVQPAINYMSILFSPTDRKSLTLSSIPNLQYSTTYCCTLNNFSKELNQYLPNKQRFPSD